MLDEISYSHQLGPFDIWCDLVLEFLYRFFASVTYIILYKMLSIQHDSDTAMPVEDCYHCLYITCVDNQQSY
jgi:hypothetical protein